MSNQQEVVVNTVFDNFARNARAWIVCFSASLFFFYEFIQMNMFNAIENSVVSAFHLSATQLGYLSSFYFAANVLFLFPAGILLDRLSTKRIILVALSICVAGTYFFSQSTTLPMAILCRFMTGIGSAFCFLSCIRLASRWFPSERMALVTGLIVTMAMIGGMMAQYPLTVLVNHVGWQQALYYDSLLGLVIIGIIALNVQDHPNPITATTIYAKSEQDLHFFRSLTIAYLNPQNWLAALYTCLMNTPIGILGVVWGSPYLTNVHHFTVTQASEVTSMIFLGTIFGGPVIGALSDKLGERKRPMLIGGLCSLVTVLFILNLPHASLPVMLVLFLALGFFSASQVLSYPTVAENNPSQLTAMAVSVISFTTQGGIWLFEPVYGALLQKQWTGNLVNGIPHYEASAYVNALYVIPAGFIIAMLAVLLLKESKKS